MKRFMVFASILAGGLILAATVVSTNAEPETSSLLGSAATAVGYDHTFREVTVPAGTVLHLRLNQGFGSDTSRVEDRVSAELARPVLIDDREALPEGSTASGYVTTATRGGKVKGRAKIGVRFDRIETPVDGEEYRMTTRPWVAVAPATKKDDAMKIAVPAAGGAAIGALIGGKKGAGIGALIGGGGGTAVVLSTRGKDVHVAPGATLAVKLAAPLTVRLRR
jgi:hypothetical protein